MAYQGKPLQPNTLVQNQFLVLRHQLYIANCNTGHVENSGSNDKKHKMPSDNQMSQVYLENSVVTTEVVVGSDLQFTFVSR